ncbi:MAG TPA: nucleotidyl transferase AbiEii/AbiGii toxin family protein [Solirubrobacteraceae bacterium]|nr:nucleotidyl transferase AbiEii/AbiGii toxin family protein [Solirubrobacteraceae bacterium]
MKYVTPEAFRAALDQRIRNEAAASGVTVMRLRKRVAFERFLARLAVVDPQRWVLKGAFALDLRLGLRTRTTKDIDLAGADDEQTATTDLIAAQAIDLHDHFSFDVTRTPALDRAEAFRAVRYTVTAEVAGRRFEQFPVDVALSEHPTVPSERLPIPSLLDFADIQPIEMPVIALEQHIAEKVHAYTATYGPHQQQSTRIKDLIDILLIAELAAPHADRLRASLDTTFSRRERQPLPAALPPPPTSWATPYARAAADVWLPIDLNAAHAEAATFLDPIFAGTGTGYWDPTQKRWIAS